MSEQRQSIPMRFYHYQRDRRKFIVKVYGLATIFILLTMVQWTTMLLCGFHKFLNEFFYITVIGLMIALLGVTAFIFLGNIRFLFPLNWIVTIFIVEGVTIGLSSVVAYSDVQFLGISFAIVAVVVICCIAFGSVMGHDLTLDVVLLFLAAAIFFIGSVFFIMLHMLAETPFSAYVYSIFVLFIVILFIMYHAQTIWGGRYAEMRLSDYLLATLIIYHDFIILHMLTFYITASVVDAK